MQYDMLSSKPWMLLFLEYRKVQSERIHLINPLYDSGILRKTVSTAAGHFKILPQSDSLPGYHDNSQPGF